MDRDEIRNEEVNRLIPLREADGLEVADHDPDVRGWDVYGADGTKIGEVEELIVSPAEMKVRYLDIELDDSVRAMDMPDNDDDERHIIIPIGRAILNDEEDKVVIDGVQLSGIREFPAYTGELSREYENRVISSFERAGQGRTDTSYQASGADTSRNMPPQENRSSSEGLLPPTAKHDKDLIPDEFYNRSEFDEKRFYAGRRKKNNAGEDNTSLMKRG